MTEHTMTENIDTYTDKTMDQFSSDSLRELLANESKPTVSVFLPTERKGAETRQNSVRLKNAHKAALEQLEQRGMGRAECEQLLQPMAALIDNYAFWQRQSDGLSILLSPQTTHIYRLPIEFEEQVIIDDLFYLKPLLPLLTGNGTFYVLTLKQGGVQLLRGSRFGFSEAELGDDVPQSLEEELQYDDIEAHLQFHTRTSMAQGTNTRAAERSAMFHGQGVTDEDETTEQVLRFFRALDNGVREVLKGDNPPPLILAGIPALQGLYRQVNHYDKLMEQGIDLDPATLDHQELHKQAWQIIEPEFQEAEKVASDYYHHLDGNNDDRAADSIETIVSAAYFQRIDTLFVTDDTPIWGEFDPDANKVHVHNEQQPGDKDLVNFAATHTYLNGGTVYMSDAIDMSETSAVAATLRY